MCAPGAKKLLTPSSLAHRSKTWAGGASSSISVRSTRSAVATGASAETTAINVQGMRMCGSFRRYGRRFLSSVSSRAKPARASSHMRSR